MMKRFILLRPFEYIGMLALGFLEETGKLGIFMVKSLQGFILPPWYFRQFFKQLFHMGYLSLPVVGLTAIFSGMVLALQSYTGFSRFNAESGIATVVVLSITRELGPVLAGLMLAGRVSASMAAEIGTMRVTEQIDALITMATNPIRYLVTPRLLAGLISLPLLVIVADIIGVMGGYIVAVYQLDFNASNYLNQTYNFLEMKDVL
jgi:phospholipid/cholesterol/gamma-HCH transport system permease protein